MIPTLELSEEERQTQTLRSETTERARKTFAAKGCLLMADAFPAAFISGLRDEYFARYERYFGDGNFKEAKSVGHRRLQLSVPFSPPFSAPVLYANPLILPILHGLLGTNLFLGIFGSVTSLPGSELQHLHRDNPLLFSELVNRFLPPYAINLFVPLVEFNERTGTTRLFPDTHLKGDEDAAKSPGFDPVVPVGSCLLMDYRLFHQGTANVSDQIRPMLFLTYHRPWFKDYRNHRSWPFLRISDEDYMKIPSDHRSLFEWVEHYRGGLY
jgi:hypothetical protein